MDQALINDEAKFREYVQQDIRNILSKAGLFRVTVRTNDERAFKIHVRGPASDLLTARPLLYRYAGLVVYDAID